AVVVALGLGDVVVELRGDRRPQLVGDGEGGVAGGDVIHQHADGANVVQRAEGHALALHLLADAVDVVGPAGDLGGDARRGAGAVQARLGVLDEALAVGALLVEQAGDTLVGVRLQPAEGQVLQLPLQLPDAQAVGQGRMDVGGEFGQVAAFRFGQGGGV